MDLAISLLIVVNQASVVESLHKGLDVYGLAAIQNSPLMPGPWKLAMGRRTT